MIDAILLELFALNTTGRQILSLFANPVSRRLKILGTTNAIHLQDTIDLNVG